MKRAEEVYNEMLYQCMEKNKNTFTQSSIASTLKMSLSVVNSALKPLRKMNAIKVEKRQFSVIDKRKILFYWASIRDLDRDVIYRTRVEKPVKKIESEMPPNVLFGVYSAYKFRFRDVPADYSEVYVYSEDSGIIKKRFPESKSSPNLFVLKKSPNTKTMTLANIYVDLWNVKEWYAKEFLKALEAKLNGILE